MKVVVTVVVLVLVSESTLQPVTAQIIISKMLKDIVKFVPTTV